MKISDIFLLTITMFPVITFLLIVIVGIILIINDKWNK